MSCNSYVGEVHFFLKGSELSRDKNSLTSLKNLLVQPNVLVSIERYKVAG